MMDHLKNELNDIQTIFEQSIKLENHPSNEMEIQKEYENNRVRK